MPSKSKIIQLRDIINKAAGSLSNEDALDAVELFKPWVPGSSYLVTERVRHEGKLYRCEQAHTSQSGWEPPQTPALWTEVAKPGEISEWKQPTGAQDAYKKGDLVRHNGFIWASTVDANVWEPGVYGWEKR